MMLPWTKNSRASCSLAGMVRYMAQLTSSPGPKCVRHLLIIWQSMQMIVSTHPGTQPWPIVPSQRKLALNG